MTDDTDQKQRIIDTLNEVDRGIANAVAQLEALTFLDAFDDAFETSVGDAVNACLARLDDAYEDLGRGLLDAIQAEK